MSPKPWYKKKRILFPGVILGLWTLSLAGTDAPSDSLPAAVELAPATSQEQPLEELPTSPSVTEIMPIAKPTPTEEPEPVERKIAPAPTPVKKAAPKPFASSCDSNYSGACVPISSDVDCAGGSGNGPAYVSGPVYVEGSDVYDLDRDGDGVACER